MATTRPTGGAARLGKPPAKPRRAPHEPAPGPLHTAAFRRLLTVRLAGQFGDGVFQASLAGAVLFNPERAASATDVAAGFAVVLLPYSLVGPFAGVLIDRWWRRQILLVANLIRAALVLGLAVEVAAGLTGAAFYGSALLCISVNRFLLSSLSASLPHTVSDAQLVGANALSTTCGAISTTAGGAMAVGVRALADPGGGNLGYAVLAAVATLPYLGAAWRAACIQRSALGPDGVERDKRETTRMVLAGLVAGAAHIHSRRPVQRALTAIALQRFCYGVSTICTVLLYRNYFTDSGFFRAGLAGLAQVVIAIAAGGAIAAVMTPFSTRRIGLVRVPALLMLLAVGVELAGGLPFTKPALILAGLVLGFVSQGVKISIDTTVQHYVDDEFRGRVFAVYDTLFNVMFVSAAVVTALMLPENGHSPAAVVAIAVGYGLVGLWYGTARRPASGAFATVEVAK